MIFQVKCLHFENDLKQLSFQFAFDSFCLIKVNSIVSLMKPAFTFASQLHWERGGKSGMWVSCVVSRRCWVRLVLRPACPAGEGWMSAAWETFAVNTCGIPEESEQMLLVSGVWEPGFLNSGSIKPHRGVHTLHLT